MCDGLQRPPSLPSNSCIFLRRYRTLTYIHTIYIVQYIYSVNFAIVSPLKITETPTRSDIRFKSSVPSGQPDAIKRIYTFIGAVCAIVKRKKKRRHVTPNPNRINKWIKKEREKYRLGSDLPSSLPTGNWWWWCPSKLESAPEFLQMNKKIRSNSIRHNFSYFLKVSRSRRHFKF